MWLPSTQAPAVTYHFNVTFDNKSKELSLLSKKLAEFYLMLLLLGLHMKDRSVLGFRFPKLTQSTSKKKKKPDGINRLS